jgi:hypothetical protein
VISAQAKDLILKVLVKNPAQRIAAKDFLLDPWMQSKKFAELDEEQSKEILGNIKTFHVFNGYFTTID